MIYFKNPDNIFFWRATQSSYNKIAVPEKISGTAKIKKVLTIVERDDIIIKRSERAMKKGYARVAELADALDSGSSEHYAHRGSSPLPRTMASVLIAFEKL